jgi:uroporphyrinogen decarboxylase
MNSRQIIDNLLRKKPAPRMGISQEGIWGDAKRNWVKEGYPADEKGEPLPSEDVFPFDMVNTGGWFDAMPIRGKEEIVEETAEWVVKRNGAGAALKWWKNKSGTPEHMDFRMTSRAVWERDYRPHLMELDRQRLNDVKGQAEGLARRRQQGLWTFFGNQFIWENMRASMGDYVMYMSLVEDPGWVHDFNRVYTDVYKTYFRILLEEVGLPDGIWIYEDLGYRGSLFCSPRTLEELIFPYYAELVAFFHSYGLPVVFHTCGYTEAALDLIVAAGFDALNPMEVKAGCDMFKFADEYGDKLAFVGGLDERI